MSRKFRNGCRRLMAFVLSTVMVISNIGANTGTVYAAEKKEETEIALFMLDGREILDAVQDLDSQQSFNLEDLELEAARRSLKKEYEKLLEPEKGKVYSLTLTVDDRMAPEDTQLMALYRTATEDVVFLFINESSEAYQFCVNIDGYETKLVKVDPASVYVERDEEEEEEKAGGTVSRPAGGSGGAGSGASGGSGSAGSSSSGGSGSAGSSGPAGGSTADRGDENISDSKGTTDHDRDDHTSSGDAAKDDDRTADNTADADVSGGTADNAGSTGKTDGTASDKGGADKGSVDAGTSDSGSSSGGAGNGASGDSGSNGAGSVSDNSGSNGTKDSVSDGGSSSSSTGSGASDSGSGSSSTGGGASDSGSSSNGSGNAASGGRSDNGSAAGSSSGGGDSDSADSGSKELSISYHQTAFVAVPLEDIQSGDEIGGAAGEEEAEVEETTTTEAEEEEGATEAQKEDPEESSPVESESAPEEREELPVEESTGASGSEIQGGSDTEEGEGTPEAPEGTSPEESTELAPEESTEEKPTETGAGKEEETTASGETESTTAPADAETEEAPDSEGGQTLDDGWEIPGKAYKSITIWNGATARAYLVELGEIEKVVAYNEALETLQVDYQVVPDGAAKIVGADTVKIGGTLYFAVEPEEDFQIISVMANGLAVEEVTDVAALEEAEDTKDTEDADTEDLDEKDGSKEDAAKDDDKAESLADWKKYEHVYKVEAEDEDLAIEVGLDEKRIPAAVYTAETDDAVFTVDVPDGAFAEEVELKASRIKDETELKTYADQANGALAADQVVAEVRAYDLSFVSVKTGEEVEPAETVSVNIQFKKAPVAKDVDKEQVTSLSVVHLPEDEDAKVMTSVDDVKETEMEFQTDSFSVYAVTLNTTAAASIGENGFATMQEAIDAAENGNTITLQKAIAENVIIEGKDITIDTNGQTWLSKNNGSTSGVGSIITVTDSTLKLIGDGKISGVSITGAEYDKLGLGWITNGNIKYRTITATNTNLIIGEEGAEGPTIEGNGSTMYPLYEANKTKGGAILVDGGSLVMNAGTVQKGCIGGTATSYGGGIAVIGGVGFTMNGGTITQNTNKKSGTRYGGGVSVEKADFTMNGGEISFNKSGSYGGGVYVGGVYNAKAQVKIENGVIKNNTSDSYGGGLYASYCDVVTDQATFSENTGSWGGGVFGYFSTTMTFNNSTFTRNTAANRGGAICNHSYNNQKLTVNACTITDNKLTKALTSTVGAGISDESGDMEITGGTVITGNTLSGGKGGGVYAYKTNGETVSFGDVTIADNEASYGGGVAIDTGTKTLTAAKKPSVTITDATKVYGNTAKDDNAVAGTTAHVSDEFLFFAKDSNAKKTGFEEHEVVVSGTGYKFIDGGDSLVETGTTSKGYYNYQESKIQKEECIDEGDVYLDPAEKAELYVWITDENGKEHGERLTKENGLCVTLKDAYEAATREGSSGLIYVCSQVTIGAEDDLYFGATEAPHVIYTRYKANQGDYMFSVRSGETVDFAGAHIDGAKVDSGKAMVEVGPRSTLIIEDGTILENGKNTAPKGCGGAVYVHGLNYTIEPGILKMTGGTIRNNSAYKGGGVYAYGGNNAYNHGTEVILTGGEIVGNTASNDGGGISIVNSATLRMETGNAIISENVSGAQGGGICIGSDWGSYDASEGYIYSGTITGNRCVSSLNNYAGGGGVHIWVGSTMRMKNVYMHDNYATGDVSGQAALYSCPTGKLAIFELDGALLTNNKSKIRYATFPDICFLGKGRYADVSEYALGGGENNWVIGTPESVKPAPRSYYQKTTSSFHISSKVTSSTIELAEKEATVFITENESHQPGSAIANNGTLIIGTETKALEVVKEWKDEEGNATEDHPHQVIVNLAYRNDDGKLVIVDTETRKDARQILSEENEWRYCWDKLGENTDWTVVEANVTGFAPEISEAVKVSNPLLDQLYRVTITNKRDKDANPGSLTVSKKVFEEKDKTAGKEGFTFAVELTNAGEGLITYYIIDAEGKKSDLQVIEDVSRFEVTINEDESFTIEGLPVGTGYRITETEESQESYAVYINGQLTETGEVNGIIGTKDSTGEVKVEDDTKVEFAYTNVETIDINGSKIWEDDNDRDGKRPQSIHVTLTAGDLTFSQEVRADEKGDWTWNFVGLPKWDADGKLLDYIISESVVEDYTTEYPANSPDAAKSYDIKNIHTPGRTSRTVEKVWNDGEDQDRVRPGAITVQLYGTVNGTKEAVGDPVTLTADSETPWSYTWKDLFVNEAGSPIVYSVEEMDVPEKYQVLVEESGTKFIMTNTYQPSAVSKTVEKRWDDTEDRDKLRPASIQARLLADGQEAEVDTPVVTLDASNGWRHTWTDLPVNHDGKAISYTVEEVQVPNGYTVDVTYDGDRMLITNTHTPTTPNDPGTPSRPPRGSRDRTPSTPTTNITPEPVPLAAPPQEDGTPLIPIDDESVPLFGMPRTGDRSVSTGALIGMMVVSLMAACGIYIKKRKED